MTSHLTPPSSPLKSPVRLTFAPSLSATPYGLSSSVTISDSPCSIPIPPNTRGVPQTSYGAISPSAVGTSPINHPNFAASYASSTSPGTSVRGRGNSVGMHYSIARQLTAFLPADYPVAEEDAGVANGKRQGKIRVLLLENINLDAAEFLKKSGYEVGSRTPRGSAADYRLTTSPKLSASKSYWPSFRTTTPSVSDPKPRSPPR